ncbi:MAG: hypothetical protein JW719_11865 [Pirellulales bacterium]|nr:hypothetical protein [Pirellulales bacterium]
MAFSSLSAPADVPGRALAPAPDVRVDFWAGEKGCVHAVIRRLFNRALDDDQLAALAGAPEGTNVDLGVYRGGLLLEFSDPAYHCIHGVARVVSRSDRLVLLVDALHIRQTAMRGRGLGLRVFSRQLAAAERLGLARIETHAGRRDDENGYYTWPRYGFAGRLPDVVRRRLPPMLAGAIDVLDLMESATGRDWWRRRGAALRLAFDVRSDSRSQRAFLDYRALRASKRATQPTGEIPG